MASPWKPRNQPWLFIGRTDAEGEAPILWPPDAKNWHIGKALDAGKDWRQEEKGTTDDEMVGWHHWFKGHEFEQTLEDGEGQGSLECCSPWGRKESDMTEANEQQQQRPREEAPEWDLPCWQLAHGFPSLQNSEKIHLCSLRHPACDIWFWQRKTKTAVLSNPSGRGWTPVNLRSHSLLSIEQSNYPVASWAGIILHISFYSSWSLAFFLHIWGRTLMKTFE